MPYEYYSDEKHLKEWLTVQKDSTAFTSFMKHNIHDCPDHAAYIERNGGIDRIKDLRAKELMLHKEENHAEL
jgi:glutaconate CoA-transferase subunit A